MKERTRRLRRGAYLLPSLFTIGNILLGFYAVVLGMRGRFEAAALLIFAAGILDNLDGKIARLTGTESDFGREFDSLADVLTFGAAPAWLAYHWGLRDYGRAGWLVPLFFVVCCATRLARFNVQATVTDYRWFVGLPAPAAAGGIASFLFFAPDKDWRVWSQGALFAALIAVGILMVSTFRYPSFKQLDLRQRWSYRAFLPIAGGLLTIAYWPTAFFLVVAIVYIGWAPLAWLGARLFRRHRPAT